jgi:hypothetical protein
MDPVTAGSPRPVPLAADRPIPYAKASDMSFIRTAQAKLKS